MADAAERLDRQKQNLDRQQGAGFLRELRSWLDGLRKRRETRRLLKELHAERKKRHAAYAKHDDATVKRLVEIRHELAERAPEIDDSSISRPESGGGGDAYAMSLANFDAIAKRPRTEAPSGLLTPPAPDEDPARSDQLVRILGHKFWRLERVGAQEGPAITESQQNLRPDLNDLHERFGLISSEHAHEFRDFANWRRTSPGVALARVEWLLEEMNPEPPPPAKTQEDLDARAMGTLRRLFLGVGPLVQDAVHSRRSLSEAEQKQLDDIVQVARDDTTRVHEALVQRLTGPTSLRQWAVAVGIAVVVVAVCIGAAALIGSGAGVVIVGVVGAFVLLGLLEATIGSTGRGRVLATVAAAAVIYAPLSWVLDVANKDEKKPGPIADCPSGQAQGRFTLPVQSGVLENRGAAVRVAPRLDADVVKRYPAGCRLQFNGYCLGAAAPDVSSSFPDIIWNQLANERGYMASATLDGFAPRALSPEPCPRGSPGPQRVSLRTKPGDDPGETGLVARAPAAPIVGFATFSKGLWEKLSLDTNGADGWGASVKPSASDVVGGAFACWAASAPAHPRGPDDAVGALRPVGRGRSARAALRAARASLVKGSEAACSP